MAEGRTDDACGWRGFRSPVGMKQEDRALFGPGLSFRFPVSPCPRALWRLRRPYFLNQALSLSPPLRT